MTKYHWKPQPIQVQALLSQADETLFGGSRGGGKTDTGQVWLIEPKYITNPRYAALVIRRNSNDLNDWIDRAKKMYAPLKPKVTGQQPEFRFPSGAVIRTGHLKDESAYEKYQGHEYQKILIEELTKIPRESDYEKLIASARSTIPNLPARVFATTNPDGPGHDWVKKRWRCDEPDKKIRKHKDSTTNLERTRLFIPATVFDNPTLMQNDPTYVAQLASIQDPLLRKQWLEGSWDTPEVEGAYYSRIINEMYDTYVPPYINTSTDPRNPSLPPAPIPPRIRDFDINLDLHVDTWWDIGVNDQTAIWFTQSEGHSVYVIDYYENSNEGLEHYAEYIHKLPYKYDTHYGPHDLSVREWGTNATRLEQARKYDIWFRQVPKLSIADGIEATRQVFQYTHFHLANTEKGVYLLKNYRKQFDEKRQVYSDKPIHDHTSHAADAFRTFAVGYFRYKKPKIYSTSLQQTNQPSQVYKTRRT